MIGAILGGLSAVASAISMIQNSQDIKDLQRKAAATGKQMQGIKETNVFAGLQAPDTSSLQAQQMAQQTAGATQAIQGMGPEGASQIANIYQAGLQQNAENMQRQAEMNYQNELTKRQAEQGVQFRNIEREREYKAGELAGIQADLYQKKLNQQQNLSGLIGSIGMAAGDIAGLSQFDYGKSAQLKSRQAGQVGVTGAYGMSTVPTYEQYLQQQGANQGMNLLGVG